MRNTNEYDLTITLTTKKGTEKIDVYSNSYRIVLRDEFVAATGNERIHSFKNHVESFVKQLKLNAIQLVTRPFKKREIYSVSYGMNTGSEINGERASIIYKATHSAQGEDVVVIPLRSASNRKATDKYDVFIPKDSSNNLYQNSYARIRQMRSVSLKRIGKPIGAITSSQLMDIIDRRVEKMLDLNNDGFPSLENKE